MKIRIIDRILLALYALLGLLALAGGCFAAIDHARALNLLQRVYANVHDALWLQIVGVVVALLLLLWTIYIFMLSLRHEPKYEKGSVSVQNTENGTVRVSVVAMESLVKQAIGRVDGLVDIKTRIVNHEDSITVRIDMTLSTDVHIPNVTMLLQRSIKSFIEEFSGIAVREVEIMVSEIVPGEAQRTKELSSDYAGEADYPSRRAGSVIHVKPVPEIEPAREEAGAQVFVDATPDVVVESAAEVASQVASEAAPEAVEAVALDPQPEAEAPEAEDEADGAQKADEGGESYGG